MHSLELGFRTILVDDCSRGIDGDDIKKTFQNVRDGNGLVVQSNEVKLLARVCSLAKRLQIDRERL